MQQYLDEMKRLAEAAWNAARPFLAQFPPSAYWMIAGGLLAVLILLIVWRAYRRRSKSALPATAPTGIERESEQESAPVSQEKISEDDATPEAVSPPAKAAPEAAVQEPGESPADLDEPAGLMKRLKNGLSKTRDNLSSGLDRILTGGRAVDDDLLESLEELLITADVGVQATMDLIEKLSAQSGKLNDAAALKASLKEEIRRIIKDANAGSAAPAFARPHVIMVVGVNGVGKTTTIGKLAARFTKDGKQVLIVAGDTFRAAAIEQLTVWAERVGAGLVKHKEHSDPAAVAYDGVEAGIARGADVVIIDTAGRLHTKVNLMEELKKIKRTIGKKLPDAPHEILMVLDATTGQNALTQARMFHEALDVTGIILTKLDGTAKGGIVVGICSSLNIPLQYIGVGEQLADLQVFEPDPFVDALF